ncbi:MAG: flavin prenyltransferase [Desulfomicrobiaceae bacterium]|jgi:4-hydroxy-3-polyprenylbenzoate decarboxylase|nr:flavin prenyltransferase [Desulfomicrobiaceae bacterium]
MIRRILLAITGASAMPYAQALAEVLGAHPRVELHGIISPGGQLVLQHEGPPQEAITRHFAAVHEAHDLAAPPSSGSWLHHGMIICPCSMATLGALASGAGHNLVHRAADVTLKERRPLILVPRETPLAEIHLRNLLRLGRMGVIIMPPCPGFYHHPRTIEDLTRTFAGRVLDQLGLPHDLAPRWGEPELAPQEASC